MTDESGDRIDERKLPAPSDIIAGKYEVEQIVASGGMGVVVLARHLHLDQRVAVKLLLPHMAERKDIVSRFLREARAAVSLRGQHAVRVYDVGVLETGAPYMVMEYLRGHDIDEELKRVGPRSPTQAAAWVLEACEAIAEAHALGIVHRDIKPANLFLARQPDGSRVVKVLDFGISKVSESETREDQKLTSTATVLGSPQYMSPEQVRNARNVDARTDIWALGVVLYELVTDLPPFPADTIPSLSAMIVSDPPSPMNVELVPQEFQAVILRCLEKDPAQRYANIVELAGALAPFVPGASRVAERIAGIARRIGHSDRPGPDSGDEVMTEPRGRPRPASPDAETVSAAGTSLPVSANSAQSDGSTFSATLQSARPRPLRKALAVAAGGATTLVIIVLFALRGGSPDPRKETSLAAPVQATVGTPAETASPDERRSTATEPSAGPAAVPMPSVQLVKETPRAKVGHGASSQPKEARARAIREPERPMTAAPAPVTKRIDPLGDRK